MSADLFVSCARGDLDVIRELESGLAERGIPTWVYVPADGEWEPAIAEAIAAARAVLFAGSSRWRRSGNCLRELELARGAGKRLGTVLIAGALPEPLRAADVRLLGTGLSERTLDAVVAWLASRGVAN